MDDKDKAEIREVMNIGKEEYYTTRLCELSIVSAETGKEMRLE